MFDNQRSLNYPFHAEGDSYPCDANGNTTPRTEGGVTYRQEFNANNRLTHVYDITGGQNFLLASFIYDGDGNLVKRFDLTDGVQVTFYIGGIYELQFNNGSLTKRTSYYPAGGCNPRGRPGNAGEQRRVLCA